MTAPQPTGPAETPTPAGPVRHHDIDTVQAEAALLGACLHLPLHIVRDLLTGLTSDSFADPRHRAVFDAITSAVAAGDPPDPIVVRSRLLNRTDGVRFFDGQDPALTLQQLHRDVPLVANAPTYRRLVLDGADFRERRAVLARLEQVLERNDIASFDELARAHLERRPLAAGVSSWTPVDLTPYIDGTREPQKPIVVTRTDGVPLLYAGRIHSVAGESESGKTMFALHGVGQEIRAGHVVVYIDLEDSADGIIQRLLDMDLPEKQVLAQLKYLTPTQVLTAADDRALAPHLSDARLVVLDAATEALAMYGIESKDDTAVAGFYRELPRRLAAHGPAVLVIDHVVKDKDTRGRYATGSQHKLAAITGAAYGLEAVQPFAVGIPGRSRLVIHKDRPGQVRPHTQHIGHGRYWVGDFTVTPIAAGHSPLEAAIVEPTTEQAEFRPTVLMTRISEVLERVGKPLGSRELLDRVKGRQEEIRRAIAVLEDDGYLAIDTGPRNARLHRLIKPYPDPEGPDA